MQKKNKQFQWKKNVVSEDSQSVEIFSIVKYLVYLVYLEILSLDIPREYKAELDDDPIINVIRTFEKHPSIRKIKGHMHTNSVFSFDYVIKEEVEKEIRLHKKKISQFSRITKDLLSQIISENFNHTIDSGIFQIH